MEKKSLTKSWINSNFRIKVYGIDSAGRKVNKLVGVSGIIALIGETLFVKFLQRAIKSMADKCGCKLRRGLQVSFYVK
jgi:hypothetical protein